MAHRLVESLRILYDFFYADGKGLTGNLINCPLYQVGTLISSTLLNRKRNAETA